MHFSDIIGHQSQKKVLLDSLSMGRIPHAQLFEGDDEQGVLAMAIAYANAVVCGDDSSKSNTRLKANGLIHPDIHFVFPTATKAEVKSKPTSSEFSAPWRQFVQVIKNKFDNFFLYYYSNSFFNGFYWNGFIFNGSIC